MANGVDAAVDRMKATGGNPSLDRTPSDAQLEHLTSGHHPVLPRGEFCECPAASISCLATFATEWVSNVARCGHGHRCSRAPMRAWRAECAECVTDPTGLARHALGPRCYSGMLPCFRFGCSTRLD